MKRIVWPSIDSKQDENRIQEKNRKEKQNEIKII